MVLAPSAPAGETAWLIRGIGVVREQERGRFALSSAIGVGSVDIGAIAAL